MALAMKTILIPVERNDLIESSLSTACLLAKAFGSYVEGFALSPELNTMMATEGIGSIVIYPTEVTVQDKTSAAESRQLFENAMRANGISPAGTASRVTVIRMERQAACRRRLPGQLRACLRSDGGRPAGTGRDQPAHGHA